MCLQFEQVCNMSCDTSAHTQDEHCTRLGHSSGWQEVQATNKNKLKILPRQVLLFTSLEMGEPELGHSLSGRKDREAQLQVTV